MILGKPLSSVVSSVFLIGLVLLPARDVGLGLGHEPKPLSHAGAQVAMGTAFTYQGRLTDRGSPANGEYDFRFALYDAATNGSQVGSPVVKENTSVSEGLFTVELDFGSGAFYGEARYLEIGVRVGSSSGAYTTLSPRQGLTPTPYALNADLLDGQEGRTFWSLRGNAGSRPGSDFLGTTDRQPLDIRVNGIEAMRIDTDGNVGIGTTEPSGRLDIRSSLNTVGTVFSLPAISQLPDPSYTHDAVMQWEGGEAKFGKWRQYFNGWEQDWALTYNAPWDYTNNHWLGRDSGDPRANIAAMMRFNIAEGNSGLNVFEIGFAPPADTGVPPDWNAAAHYTFYDGRWSATSPMPARFVVSGAADMDATLTLSANSTYHPVRVNLTAVGANPSEDLFKIQNADTGLDLLAIKTTSGNVGIGTGSPQSTLQVVGNYIQFPTISGGPPSATDCDSMVEAGRIVVRTDGPPDLYVCTGTNWVGK